MFFDEFAFYRCKKEEKKTKSNFKYKNGCGVKKSLCQECLVRMYIFVYTLLFLYSKNISLLTPLPANVIIFSFCFSLPYSTRESAVALMHHFVKNKTNKKNKQKKQAIMNFLVYIVKERIIIFFFK